MIAIRKSKPNFLYIILNPDPEPRNKRASGKINYNSIKKGRLCPIFKPVMVPKVQPRNKLAKGDY